MWTKTGETVVGSAQRDLKSNKSIKVDRRCVDRAYGSS